MIEGSRLIASIAVATAIACSASERADEASDFGHRPSSTTETQPPAAAPGNPSIDPLLPDITIPVPRFSPPKVPPERLALLEARAIALRAEVLPAPLDALRAHAIPKTPPDASDWLAQHEEPGQSVAAFRGSQARLPGRTIYVATAGSFSPQYREVVREMGPLLAAYFQLEVKRSPQIPEIVARVKAREGVLGPQWLTHTILDALEVRRPADALAFMAITPVDLYPDPSWNFVYGQARYTRRVGVMSVARDGDPDTERSLLQRRAFATASHEIGHMLGLRHCIAWECIMNGVNHRAEADARPLEPCPSCLAKLHLAIGFDPDRRWRELVARYAHAGLGDDARVAVRSAELVRSDRP